MSVLGYFPLPVYCILNSVYRTCLCPSTVSYRIAYVSYINLYYYIII